MILYGNLTRSQAAVVLVIVDDTELSWGDAMYPVFRMYDKFVISGPFQSGWMIQASIAL